MPAPEPSAPGRAPRPSLARDVPQILLPLLVGATLAAFAHQQAEPTAGAESAYLARLATVVLLCVAVLAPRASRLLGWAAIGTVTLVAAAPPGATRASATVALLLTVLGLAVARRTTSRRGAIGALDSVPFVLAMAVALQALMRPDLLLPPLGWRSTLVLVGLPILASVAVSVLARTWGLTTALSAGAAVVVLTPGLDAVGTLMLCAAAGGTVMGDLREPRWRRIVGLAVIVSPMTLVPLTIGADARSPGLALATLLASLAGLGLAGAATARTRDDTSSVPRYGASACTLTAAIGAVAIVLAVRPWAPGAWAVAVLTALVLVPSTLAMARTGWPVWVAGLALLVAGASAEAVSSSPSALVPGLIVLVTLVPPVGAWARLQLGWTAGWTVAVTLCAAYPWLRPTPLETFFGWLPQGMGATAVTVVSIFAAVGALARRRPRWAGSAATGIAALVALAMLLAEQPRRVVVADTIVLDADNNGLSRRIDPPIAFQRLMVESQLVESLELAPGTAIGSVQLLDAQQRPLAHWRLVAGDDTAEWAAARSDVAARPGFRAPPPWSGMVAPSGDHFSLRFRSLFETEDEIPSEVGWVLIRRRPTLPPKMRIVISRVELRP